MSTASASAVPVDGVAEIVWAPEPGAAVRGSLVLLPGRGEPASVYARFGRRLAADGYLVRALDATAHPDAASVAAAFAEIAPELPAPVVLAGSDAGALYAAGAVAGGGVGPAGLVLAGLPVGEADSVPVDWEGELAARTACPAHRGVLTDDAAFSPGALAGALPDEQSSLVEVLVRPDLPVLVVHGGADPLAPIAEVRRLAATSTRTTLVAVADGRHDVLNDAAHRSVAAQIVLWLERLRGGPDPARVLTVEEWSS